MTLGIMNTVRVNFQPWGRWYSTKATNVPKPTCSVRAITHHQSRFFNAMRNELLVNRLI